MKVTDPVVVLVDDVRFFVDQRACLVARTPGAAVEVLADLAQRAVAVDELWLDWDAGGGATFEPVLTELERLDATGDRLQVGIAVVITSSPSGAVLLRRRLEALGYAVDRLYDLHGLLAW